MSGTSVVTSRALGRLEVRWVWVAVAVAALHAGVVGVLQGGHAGRSGTQAVRTAIVYVQPEFAPPARPAVPSARPAPPDRRPAYGGGALRARATPGPVVASPPSKPTVLPEGPVPETSVASDPAIAPSPSPSQQPRLMLDTPALRRAIREIAGTSSPEQRAARPERQPDAPDDAAGPLASGMSAAAHGDCLKGDFKGSGMGLLSLPMLALAAAQGRCAGR